MKRIPVGGLTYSFTCSPQQSSLSCRIRTTRRCASHLYYCKQRRTLSVTKWRRSSVELSWQHLRRSVGWLAGWLEFNVAFQQKHGYIRYDCDDRLTVAKKQKIG